MVGKEPSPHLSYVRRELRQFFAGCPDAVAAHFCALLDEPAATVIAHASLTLRKPYGQNHILSTDGEFGISFACFLPGQATSLHYHEQRREFFCVHSGVLLFTSGATTRQLGVRETGNSTPHVPHSLRNGGHTDLRVLEMFSPAILSDKVRLSDHYGRALGSVSLHE